MSLRLAIAVFTSIEISLDSMGEAACAKTANLDIGLDKRFLCQVVAQVLVAQGEVHEEPPESWLIGLDKRPKCAPVVGKHASGYQLEFFYFR